MVYRLSGRTCQFLFLAMSRSGSQSPPSHRFPCPLVDCCGRPPSPILYTELRLLFVSPFRAGPRWHAKPRAVPPRLVDGSGRLVGGVSSSWLTAAHNRRPERNKVPPKPTAARDEQSAVGACCKGTGAGLPFVIRAASPTPDSEPSQGRRPREVLRICFPCRATWLSIRMIGERL